ncbi:sororin [Scyliorhinus torazame]|uniref:sororin n=1 Tax=Scyliorhinus torazame TaxID=75743 RepID=UPI003B5ACFEF
MSEAQKRVSGEPRQSPRLTKPTTAAPRRSPRLSPEATKENVWLSLGSPPGDEAVGPPPAGGGGRLPGHGPLGAPEHGHAPEGAPFVQPPEPLWRPRPERARRRLPGVPAPGGRRLRHVHSEPAAGVAPVLLRLRGALGRRGGVGGLAGDTLMPKEAAVLSGQVTHDPVAELAPSPDLNIPGIAIAKQKKKKRKIPQIEKSTLDEWAAQMNASFEEAERFDLLVE